MPNNHDPFTDETNIPQDPKENSEIQQDFVKKLQAVGSDLWGALSGGTDYAARKPAPAAGREAAPAGKAATSAPKTAGKEAGTPPAADPELRRIWKTADATIDWTDALGHETPTDGLTAQRLWDLYHRLALKVLEGDLDAYVEVLTTTNPLGDLTEYVNGMVIRTPSADRLECRFECRRELMEREGRLYLGGVGLRIARDLLATLPVGEVYVEGNLDGERKLGVIYSRQTLLKRNPVFLDPVALVEECGGLIET